MPETFFYFPILKTRPSEITAYELLNDSIKDEILPIIEMTGALGYRFPKNYKVESLRGKKHPGNINKKVDKILYFIGKRRFILDITDDDSLKYDGLGEANGGLLDPTDGYTAWISFLEQNTSFKEQVIPTIQFNTMYRSDVEKQIKFLSEKFDYIAIKLPAFLKENNTAVPNSNLQQIIDFILNLLTKKKELQLILILDFDYQRDFDKAKIESVLTYITNIKNLKAVIPVSSSFPNSVANCPHLILVNENDISDCVKNKLNNSNIYHGDYSAIHPTKYEMGGGGWIPRIDYVFRDVSSKRPQEYNYERGSISNVSNNFTTADYIQLASQVINSNKYKKIDEISVEGDNRILAKANGGKEGNAPSYWITVRSNIYMAMQYFYLKKQGSSLTL